MAATEGEDENEPSEVTAKLSEEAGISAYMQTSGPISLDSVKDLFRTIEMENNDYIIGSVDVTDYAEYWDIHVYVHTDGWILAYYLNTDETSKIVDVKAETLSATLLEKAVSTIAGAVGERTSDLKYYDFRFPNATNILLIGEDSSDGSDFYITLPSDYIYYEHSWVQYHFYYNDEIEIDGARQPVIRYEDNVNYGPINSTTLILDEPHQVLLGDEGVFGAIAITYRIP